MKFWLLKNNKRYELLVCFSLMALLSFSQQREPRITGFVKDDISLKPIANAIVQLDNSQLITQSDSNGYFYFSIEKTGKISFLISHIGYYTFAKDEYIVSGKNITFEFLLTSKSNSLKEVAITANQFKTNNNLHAFDLQSSQRIAGAMNDPAKLALSYAGVTLQSDFRNAISVRGNTPEGVAWQLNDILVPNPNHLSYQNSIAGSVCIINNNVLNQSNFQITGFSAATDQAVAGLFDLKLRNGNVNNFEGSFRFGTLGIEGTFEGPLSKRKNASILLNYRYSTISLLEKMGYPVTGAYANGKIGTNYQDATLSLFYKTKKAGEFSFWAVGGLSFLKEYDSFSFNSKTYYNELMTGLSHKIIINNKNSLHTTLGFTILDSKYVEPTFLEGEASNHYVEKALRLHTKLKSKINERLKSESGIKLNVQFANSTFYNSDFYFDNKTHSQIQKVNNVFSGAAYTQLMYQLSEKSNLQFGLQAAFFAINKKATLEPRFTFNHQFNKNNALQIYAGLHSQSLFLALYFYKFDVTLLDGRYFKRYKNLDNRDLDLLRSLHLSTTYQFSFKKDFSIAITPYCQYLFKVPINDPLYEYYKDPASTYLMENYALQANKLKDNGIGLNYGIDFTFEKKFSKNYYFIFNQSLFESKFRSYDNIWRNTAYSTNYLTNFSTGYDLVFGKKKQHTMRFTGRLIFSGGRRFRDIDSVGLDNAGHVLFVKFNEDYNGRTAPYLRGDLQIAFRSNAKNVSYEIKAEIQNFTNHKNELYRTPNSMGGYNIIYQAGIIPVISFEVYTSFKKKTAAKK